MTRRILTQGRYGLADLLIGDTIKTASRRITAKLIDNFADTSGDRFEIHMDTVAARRHGFSDRVAHGLLVLSVVDGLKNQTPAQFAAIASLGWEWHFAAPVLVGDTIAAVITVTDLRATSDGARGIVTLSFDVSTQHGVSVQSGTNRLMIYT